jgi:hypothetical protein
VRRASIARKERMLMIFCGVVESPFERESNEVGAVSQNCAAVKKEERNENGAPSLEAASVPTMSIHRRGEITRR